MQAAWDLFGRAREFSPTNILSAVYNSMRPRKVENMLDSVDFVKLWIETARLLHSKWNVCNMDQELFFQLIARIDPQFKAEKVDDAESRHRWLIANGWDGEAGWMCEFIGDKIGAKDATILEVAGIGKRSFVAIVLFKGKKQALRAIEKSETVSPDEHKVARLLSKKSLAPRIVHQQTTSNYNIEIMDAVVTTLFKFITTVRLDKAAAKNVAKILLFYLGELQKLGVMHGDLHFGNIGLTADGSVLLFDFDQSSTHIFIPGFDCAVVLQSLILASSENNAEFFEEIISIILDALDDRWKARGVLDEQKLVAARKAWQSFVRVPLDYNRKSLEKIVGPL